MPLLYFNNVSENNEKLRSCKICILCQIDRRHKRFNKIELSCFSVRVREVINEAMRTSRLR